MTGEGPRCFLCDARMLAPTTRTLRYPSGRTRRFALGCASCGVLLDRGTSKDAAWNELAAKLCTPRFESPEDAPFGLDVFTLVIAASRLGRVAVPDGEAQQEALRQPHSPLAATVRLSDLRPEASRCVALGILCAAADLDRLLASLSAHRRWTDRIVVMVDAPASTQFGQALPDGVHLLARSLGDDFAAQRNALQAASAKPWMLQLDTDETLAPETAALLPALAAHADAAGAVSIGLPRRNRVDGALADLYPDVQYRLNRREVRYAGIVHERPERPWQQGTIALHGAIEHHLTCARVLARSPRYEAMAPGRGRMEEMEALLRPYRP